MKALADALNATFGAGAFVGRDSVAVETDCTYSLKGREFHAGGAILSPDWVLAYPTGEARNVQPLNDWHGREIGTCRVLSSWRTPRSFVSDRMFSYECLVNGVRYVGRGAGKGMILRAKRSTVQPKVAK